MSLAPAFLPPVRRIGAEAVGEFLGRLYNGATVLRCVTNDYDPAMVGKLFTVTLRRKQSMTLLGNDRVEHVARWPERFSDFDEATPTRLGYRINGPYKILWENVPIS